MDSGDKMQRNKCPIPDTHARLNQAFSLFQNILEDYQDQLRFTSALNNLIQNLRNVTFVLQKELAHKEDFDIWYSQQQDKMKQDDSLKWLVNARNHVVKQGDLKKKSYANVRLKDHYDHELVTMELDPTLSTKEIATDFCKKVDLKIPKNLLEQTVVEVERVWIVDEYPKAEVIDVLIYCFGFLTDLVYTAHEELLETDAVLCEENIYVEPSEHFMSVLHNKIKKGRTTRINYKTGEIYGEYTGTMYRPDDKILKKTQKRYGDQKSISSLIDTSGVNIPFNNIKFHLEMSRNLFKIDGSLLPMAFLYFPDQPPMHIVLGMNDPATKYLIFEHLAEKVEETGCRALVLATEAWGGDMPNEGEEYVPAHLQRKKEFIWIIGVTPEKTEDYQIEIIRHKDGSTTLEKEKKMKESKYPALDRIYRIWSADKSSESNSNE